MKYKHLAQLAKAELKHTAYLCNALRRAAQDTEYEEQAEHFINAIMAEIAPHKTVSAKPGVQQNWTWNDDNLPGYRLALLDRIARELDNESS